VSQQSADPVTILVADDEPDIVALVERRLVRAGYRVITAADGREALQLAQREAPALAVLDVMMPLMTGIEVSRRLRSMPATREIPVILISAGLPDKLIPGDADAFVSKPFGRSDLPLMVRSVLAGPGRPRTAEPQHQRLGEPPT
jgi:CheY-like chemotaxis protein